MSSRTPEIPIDDDDSHENGDGIHDEGEEQIFGNQWKHKRCRRQNFRDEQQEDHKWEQNTDAKCNLLTSLSRQIEDKNAKEWNEHGWKN